LGYWDYRNDTSFNIKQAFNFFEITHMSTCWNRICSLVQRVNIAWGILNRCEFFLNNTHFFVYFRNNTRFWDISEIIHCRVQETRNLKLGVEEPEISKIGVEEPD
jgi:hypothetical protein